MSEIELRPILFFDGVCNLCNGLVRFIIKWEREPKLYFCSLQSKVAAEILSREGVPDPGEDPDTLWLMEDGVLHGYSDAAIRVAKYLRFPFSWFSIFFYLPKGVRDGLYRWIANRRYALFGRRESCSVFDFEGKRRFLE